MKNKAYITGVGGVVGSYLGPILADRGYLVEGSYYTPTMDLKDFEDPRVKKFEMDLRDHKKVEEYICSAKPDAIFHLAAQSRPVRSWDDPYYTMDVNVNGTVGLFEAIRKARQLDPDYDPMVVMISSSAIYGEALLAYDEDHLPDETCAMLPLHPYGVSKAAEDLLGFQYYRNYGIKTARVRLFNCTGPGKTEDITGDLCVRAVELEKKGSNKMVVGNLSALRAIIHVKDLCNGLIILAEKATPGEAYNICSSHIFRMDYVVTCIEKVMGVKYELIQDPKLLRPADERFYGGSSKKIEALGWKEEHTYEELVAETIAYWRKKLA